MNRLTAPITSVLVVVATLLSVACSHAIDAPSKAGAGQRLKTIIEDNYHPYSFINEQGQPDGFSVELARAVAKAMDLELEMRAGKWDLALKELEAGQIDLIPIIAYSPEWEKIFNFSVPYTVVYDAVFFRKGTTGISSLKDLSGKTVIVTNKDLAHDYLLSSGLSKTMNIVLVKSGPDALKQLAAGNGDAAIMPKLIGLVTAKKLKLVDIDTSPLLVDDYTRLWGFAVKAGNLALLERINQGLNIIKSSGEYDAIYKKWFGALEGTHFNLKMLLPYGAGALLIFLGIITWNVMLKRQVKAKTDNLVAEIDQRKQAEELLRESGAALQTSEQEFHSLAEAMPQIVWITRPDGWNIYFNHQWVDYTGLTIEESYGHGWNTPFHPDDQQRAWDAWQSATQNDATYSVECRLRRADGDYRWWLIRGVPLRDASGKILKWFGTCTDIEDIKQATTALQQKAEALRQKVQALRASNDELELFNLAATGRELRMIELKEEINELCRRLGEPPRHATGPLETDSIPGAGPAPAESGGGGV